MSEESLIRTYETRLKGMEALDRNYYGNQNPSLAERAAYHRRKQRAEELRARFYAALESIRSGHEQLWLAHIRDAPNFRERSSLALN